MDTRQLAAFVAVVDKKSFSQAAERLGVTQPAISLQIRSLEDRLGRRLLDRSGRRVEPTEAGLVLYKRAQRMLQIEQQLEEELAQEETGELHGTLAIGASTGPGGRLVPLLLCEFQRGHPELAVSLSISDTDRVIEQVGERELELGVVGRAPPAPCARVRAARARRDRPRRPARTIPTRASRCRRSSCAASSTSRCRRERACAT